MKARFAKKLKLRIYKYEYDKIDKLRGMEITIVTSARNDDQARALLKLLGMPFSGSKKEA